VTTHPTAPATRSPSPGPLAQLAHAQAAAATDDPSEESLAAALAALVGHVDYPCLGARSVFRRDAVTLLVLDDLTDDGPGGDLERLTAALRDYVRDVDVDGDLVSFVACFRGPVRAGEREFEADLWAALQHLHDTDGTAWSEEVSPDPVDPHFGFSLDGTPLFVVGLHPHASRIARRAPVPTLVFNLHAQFERLRADAATDTNLMDATLECARAGVTTGEWAGALREVFGEFRAPTGVSGSVGTAAGSEELAHVRRLVADTGAELGEKLRVLVGKPGLDGHSNGAEQVAVRARDAGFEVVYQGIRLTPEQIVGAAVAEDVHLVGLSILSGSHMELVPEVLERMREAGAGDVPVIVGGIIPEADAARLKELGVAEVFTPKDFGLNDIMARFVDVIRASRGLTVGAGSR